MRNILIGLTIAGLLTSALRAWSTSEAYDFESIIVSSTAVVGITASKIAQPQNSASPCAALVSVEGQSLRFRVDGSSPTNTAGHLVTSGNSFNVDSWRDLRELRLIGQTATSTATVTLFRGCR